MFTDGVGDEDVNQGQIICVFYWSGFVFYWSGFVNVSCDDHVVTVHNMSLFFSPFMACYTCLHP